MFGSADFLRSAWRCGFGMIVLLGLLGRGRVEGENIGVSADKKGFVSLPSGERFVPWGNNYSGELMELLAHDPGRVERDFAEMKAAGANVVRISPEMPAFFVGANQIDAGAVERFRTVLGIAEKSGLRLHITGLACFRITQRMAWYDALDDEGRWKTQELFWETIAKACALSSAVFCYDLMNEPVSKGKRADGWYLGRMGEMEFCQRLSLDSTKSGDEIFREWTGRMVGAIRKSDTKHMITIGMLTFPNIYKVAAEQLDFVSPHIYPESKKVPEAIGMLKKFDFGKPIEIGETFVLKCSEDEEREFLFQSRGTAAGWLGQWPEEGPAALRELKKSGKITLVQGVWLSWVELFEEVGGKMKG